MSYGPIHTKVQLGLCIVALALIVGCTTVAAILRARRLALERANVTRRSSSSGSSADTRKVPSEINDSVVPGAVADEEAQQQLESSASMSSFVVPSHVHVGESLLDAAEGGDANPATIALEFVASAQYETEQLAYVRQLERDEDAAVRYNITLGFESLRYIFHLAVLCLDLAPNESRNGDAQIDDKDYTNGPDFGLVLVAVSLHAAGGLVLLFAWATEPLASETMKSIVTQVRAIALAAFFCGDRDAAAAETEKDAEEVAADAGGGGGEELRGSLERRSSLGRLLRRRRAVRAQALNGVV